MRQLLLTLPIARESDVVAVRQRVRRAAEALGLDRQDQIRLATAVSEVARNAQAHAGGGRAEIGLGERDGRTLLLVRVSDTGPGIADPQAVLTGATGPVPRAGGGPGGLGLVSARRLADHFVLTSTPGLGTIVELGKALPSGRPLPCTPDLATSLAAAPEDDPAAALREQNRELLSSLEALRERQDELEQLRRELEDTNHGVVALYAELDEKAAELRHASELKTRFISNMSHEFRTPLNSILALSRLLLDRTDGELTPEQDKQVQFIRQSAGGLLELVNDLLDIAKIEAGKVEVRCGPVHVAELFAGLRGMLKPLPSAHGVELVFEPRDLSGLHTDETKITQILRNLVSNALKFTEHGHVRVSAAPAGQSEAVFTVADTGIGIAPADQPRIFEEFEQVESGLQTRSKGTGLGLPLSRRLAELLGGSLTVESAPGAGSTFRLRIPLRHPAAAPAPPALAAGRRALIVDDEEAARYVLRRLLTADPDWEVIEAADGLTGLRQARELHPDLIMLDLNMPGLDGFSVLRELAGDPATAALPVVVCTSLRPDATLRRQLPAGTAVLSKSALDRASLQAALREAGLPAAPEHAG